MHDERFVFIICHFKESFAFQVKRSGRSIKCLRVEQFRMMAFRDEEVLVSGVLEQVERKNTEYEQIAISYVPGWEANVLKTIDAVEY